MELYELQILKGQTSANNHSISISRASMGTCAAEVRTSISTGCQNSLMCSESVQCTIFHVERNDTNTFAILHDQVESKELDKEVGVVAKRLAIESVQKSMTCTVGGGGTTICLSTLPILKRLATKSTLVNFSLLRSRKWNTKVFELVKRLNSDHVYKIN